MDAFPLLLAADGRRTAYEGLVGVGHFEGRVRLELCSPGGAVVRLWTCATLTALLGPGGLAMLRHRMRSSHTLDAFAVELRDLLERALREAAEGPRAAAAALKAAGDANGRACTRLVRDLDGLWQSLVWLHPSLAELKLSFSDTGGRRHELDVRLPPAYPSVPPLCHSPMPSQPQLQWGPSSTLAAVVQQYREATAQFETLWEQLEDLDNHCWVLEPASPTFDSTLRRLALGNHCSVQLELLPEAPKRLPECRLLGSDKAVAPYRAKFHANYRLWDEGRSVRENLEALLETTFPPPVAATQEEWSLECAICYAYRLEEATPDRVCENEKCGRSFHSSCLYEWLRTAATNQSFDTVFGECPYCTEAISVKKQ